MPRGPRQRFFLSFGQGLSPSSLTFSYTLLEVLPLLLSMEIRVIIVPRNEEIGAFSPGDRTAAGADPAEPTCYRSRRSGAATVPSGAIRHWPYAYRGLR